MKFFTKRMRSQKGFTLIELIIVIAIIGILAAILLPRFGDFTTSAEDRALESTARNIYTITETMRAQGSVVPVSGTQTTSFGATSVGTVYFDGTITWSATGFSYTEGAGSKTVTYTNGNTNGAE